MMRTPMFKWTRLGLALLVLASLVGLTQVKKFATGLPSPVAAQFAQQLAPQKAAAQAQPAVGLVCTNGSGQNPSFTLNAQDGYIVLGDGNTMYMWSYAPPGVDFQYPGPVLCVDEGATVTVVLNNNLPENVSIMFPGQENVQADGAPAQPQFDGAGNLTSLTNTAAPGGSVTYSFVASKPGTYLYESGTNPEKQVRMGLAGALVVRPALGATFAYDRPDSQFTPGEEFLVFLSEIDPYQHQAAEQNKPYDLTKYHVHYWLINGRTFPDSIADNYASWLPSQPYGALARIHPFNSDSEAGAAYHPYPGLARYINVGFEEVPFHPHGNNGSVIARDGQPLEGPAQEDLSFEKFSINIGPGQTWDVLFKWYDAENYSKANPVPVTVPDMANQTIGMFYSGSPYLGQMADGKDGNPLMPPGVQTLNQCGEFYIIAHNHALFQLDAWGMTMAGQITYMRIDPPLPNNCP